MVKIINHKECTCDICGKIEHIKQESIPKGWNGIKLGYKEFDVCLECSTLIDFAIEDLIEKNHK